MANISVTRILNAPLPAVWAAWDAFGEIARFNPGLSNSYLLDGSPSSGLGAERQCDLADGRNFLRERIIGYQPLQHMEIEVFACSLPIRNARMVLDFSERAADETEIHLSFAFQPKYLPFGYALLPALKPQLAVSMGRLLAGNETYVRAGVHLASAAPDTAPLHA